MNHQATHRAASPRRLGTGTALAALLATSLLAGCVPLVVGGAAVGTAMMVSDRRTSGAQLEDEGIELRANNRIKDVIGDNGHVGVTSYNRIVLLTGEVPNEQIRARIADVVARIDNVKSVANETTVGVPSSIARRSGDSITTGRVKAALVDTRNIQSRAIKVVTEGGVTYLMGIVTQREADLAAEVTRNVPGVNKVVRVFQIVTEAELARAQEVGAAGGPRVAAPAPILSGPQPAQQPLPAASPLPPQTVPVQTMPVR